MGRHGHDGADGPALAAGGQEHDRQVGEFWAKLAPPPSPGEALAYFYRYSWPGNVRELKNFIENGVIMAEGELFDLSHLDQPAADFSPAVPVPGPAPPFVGTLKEALERTEKACLLQALESCGGRRLQAMRLLGLSKRTFYRKMRHYGL
jgi:DNA-binding NtrC family response regulator